MHVPGCMRVSVAMIHTMTRRNMVMKGFLFLYTFQSIL